MLSGALVVVSVTLKLFVSPGASVSDEGWTVTAMPLIDEDAVYVADLSPTFVTRRVTVAR